MSLLKGLKLSVVNSLLDLDRVETLCKFHFCLPFLLLVTSSASPRHTRDYKYIKVVQKIKESPESRLDTKSQVKKMFQ